MALYLYQRTKPVRAGAPDAIYTTQTVIVSLSMMLSAQAASTGLEGVRIPGIVLRTHKGTARVRLSMKEG